MIVQIKNIFIGLLMISLLLVGCQKAVPEPTPTLTASITPTRTATLTPSPIRTLTPTRTITPTPEPTSTATPTPTETVQWDQRGLALTPIPLFNEVIATDNTNRVDALAVWGNGKANTIALSPNSDILAVGTGIGAVLYDSLNFLLIATLPTPFTVQSIAFSPDNLSIALGQSEGRIDIYELASQALIARLDVPGISFTKPHQVKVHFSPNGGSLISIIKIDGNIFINRWDTANWQPSTAFVISSGLAAYINPNADLIGIIDAPSLVLQSLSFAEETSSTPLPASEPSAFWENIPVLNGEIAASTRGDFILVNNGTAIIHWKLLEEAITYRLDQYPDEFPDPCYDAPNSCRNAQGGFSWVCATGVNIPSIETIQLTPNNAMLLVSRNDNRSEFRRSSDGLLVWEINVHFTDVAFSTNMDYFFGLKPDGTIEKRSNSGGELLDTLNQHPSQLNALSFSPDGGALAAGYNDGWIRVYSPFNGEMLGVLNGSASALQFSRDGRLLAAGLEDGTVRVFELALGQYYDLANGHFDKVTGIAFSSGGDALLTASHDCTTSTWDLGGRYRRQNVNPGGMDPFQIASTDLSSNDESQYVLAQGNGLYQISATETTVIFAPPNLIFTDLALSPDGRILALTGPSTWFIPVPGVDPLSNPQELVPNLGGRAYALAFTPDGAVLIVAKAENLEFWSVVNGLSLADLPFSPSSQGTNLPVDLTVSPDGSLIVLARQDGLIHIFAVVE